MIKIPSQVKLDTHKSWKKINEERKALRKKRKQENLIKQVEDAEKLEEAGKKAKKVKRNPPSTVSIAVPGSILENAQSVELRSYLAGQIARAVCIFRVNEVIIFDDVCIATARQMKRLPDSDTAEGEENKVVRGSSLHLARILQYLECPQYLRKYFFPLHDNLKYSGLLNPLDAPHHLRQQNYFPYREGIVQDKAAKEGQCYVNVGLLNDVLVNKRISSGTRVTVRIDEPYQSKSKKIRGTVVSPQEPRQETGVYWGYNVRIAHTLSELFTKSPYQDGYDLTIGTSDKGCSVEDVEPKSLKYNHLLIVFGGLKGLEAALSYDDSLKEDNPEVLFDYYLNVLPQQGSRTIRTEEAVLIAMTALQGKLNPKEPDVIENFSELLPQSSDTNVEETNHVFNKIPAGDMSRFD